MIYLFLLVISVASLVVLTVPDGSESLWAVIAFVRLFTSMSSHMNKKVSFLSKDLATTNLVALKEILAWMGRLVVKVKPWSSWERFLAAREWAHISIDILMAAIMMFKMLFKFKGLAATWILALENSVGKLKIFYWDNEAISYMSSNVCFQVSSFIELSIAASKWAMKLAFVVFLLTWN